MTKLTHCKALINGDPEDIAKRLTEIVQLSDVSVTKECEWYADCRIDQKIEHELGSRLGLWWHKKHNANKPKFGHFMMADSGC